MKYIILCILLIPTFCFSQTYGEKWDAKNLIYVNHEYGFKWDFPKGIGLHRVTPEEYHTIFKVSSSKNTIAAFVNANKCVSMKKYKIEDLYYKYIEIAKHADEISESSNGEHISDRTFSHCTFCGQSAIKTTYTSTINDDRYKTPLVSNAIDYIYIKYGSLITVSLKYDKELEKFIKISNIEDIFKGYSIIYKSK